jgi:hypothetical protein
MKDLENNGFAGPCAEVLQKDVEVLDTKAASGQFCPILLLGGL